MKAGDKVVCIDSKDWLRPDIGTMKIAEGQTYVVREFTREFSHPAISLVGGRDTDFYLARRFRKLDEIKEENRQRTEQSEPATV